MDTSKQCPICRTITYFVVPSSIWPANDQEKEEITRKYKERLEKIDCRLYQFGKSTCPFGTSCFFRHVDEYGVSQKDQVRILSNDDFDQAGLKVMKQVQLFDFLDLPK